jgi:hypothetical protein
MILRHLTYKQLDAKASNIITKLKNEINSGNVYENQGQKELRQFTELVNKEYATLTHQERYQLTSMLSTSIDNLW